MVRYLAVDSPSERVHKPLTTKIRCQQLAHTLTTAAAWTSNMHCDNRFVFLFEENNKSLLWMDKNVKIKV